MHNQCWWNDWRGLVQIFVLLWGSQYSYIFIYYNCVIIIYINIFPKFPKIHFENNKKAKKKKGKWLFVGLASVFRRGEYIWRNLVQEHSSLLPSCTDTAYYDCKKS